MKLGIISFNIRCCNDRNGHSIEERAPRLETATTSFDADIIGLQEMRPAWETHLDRIYSDKYDIYYKYRAENELETSPILWRKDKYECISKGFFWLSDTPEKESKGWDEKYDCYRMCLYVNLREKETGKMLTFMNTHFGFGDNCQTKSAQLIYDYSKQISDYPTIIVGDFNMTPKTAGYAAMTKNFVDVNAATVKDMRSTYHGYKPEGIVDMHIDYCFINDKVTPVNRRLIDASFDGKFPSDHYGLYMEVEI